MAEHRYASQVEFASGQPQEGSPDTLFRLRPTRSFELDFFNDRPRFPDGAEHEIWCFETETSGRRFPAPLLRVTEGDVVHATIKPAKAHHTLHWHGIEPDPRNDGVGHTSFEVSGGYTYQWIPQRGRPGDPNVGSAGTYFYHCHVNTPLHVQMGMFGPLLVDPAPDAAFPTRPGARRPFVDGPEYDVRTETLIVPYALDPRWHDMEHAAGLSGEDVGLNRFEPRHFYLLGGQLATPRRGDGVSSVTGISARVITPQAAASSTPPLPTLLRVLNGGYHLTRLRATTRAGAPARILEVIAHDGRQFRDTSVPGAASRPLRIRTSMLGFGAAERYELLLAPEVADDYVLHVDWIHWVRGDVMATRSIPVTLIA